MENKKSAAGNIGRDRKKVGRAGRRKAPSGYGGVRPKKGLGQNFLIDEGVIDAIAGGCGADAGALVIEIGPGTGALTLPLTERAGFLAAVELDDSLIEPLRVKTFGAGNVKIIHEDILKLDIDSLISELKDEYKLESVRVVGNLPYYITTPIIMKLLEEAEGIDSITVMMQKEVADRISAEPGERLAGAITYSVHYYAEVSKVVDVPRECFYPVPNVDSEVLRLDIRKEPAVRTEDADFMFKCIKTGFSQRRKTLLNSLSAMEGTNKEKVAKALFASGIEENRRAETLSLAEFAKLADILREE
ncbi:MAG: 16S rRNA (adenine(1518)-N(6)/adenine(1519)-N(6))-dimethyltransferase RsmA [Mogibacterium sp.]|nr:16S rRNA (adenine(1518)-N(6)/adenine(1519)-N(6))-dimethyltransferase RsmA [Mogibacterium sp.]